MSRHNRFYSKIFESASPFRIESSRTADSNSNRISKLRRSLVKGRPIGEVAIAVNGTVVSKLRDVTCHMESHSVTCHPIQVNASRLTPANKLVLDLPTPEG